jgi:hypothetical protein
MQPVQVSVTSAGYATPTFLGLALLGLILLPIAIRLIGPPLVNFARPRLSKLKLPALWTYTRKSGKH